jgi:NAD(P)-dependent dehydrogenase (short-subunit alcohol dehydrogenase family)
MTGIDRGTVLITGPTSGLGRALTLELASRAAVDRPDLLLVGRPGDRLTNIADAARAAGATVEASPCDLSRLANVRAAGAAAKDLLASGTVRPLRALVANAGLFTTDTRGASSDGYEMTFAVNYLAHAQLIDDLLGSFTPPARIVLLGSNVYRGTPGRRMMGAPAPQWRDPVEIAKPATGNKPSGYNAAGAAYATSKLAILYYAHELQRHVGDQIAVLVFEPGFMPGTGLVREQGPVIRALLRGVQRLPGVASPATPHKPSPRSSSTTAGRTSATEPSS